MIIKAISTEVAISTANTVALGKLVRIVNPTASAVLATVANTTANTGSFTIPAQTAEIVKKDPTNTVQGTGLLATSVTFTH